MSTLTAAPYSYAFDDLVLVRVLASNLYGDSAYGYNTGTARIRSIPDKMPNITIDSYSDIEIVISWASLTGVASGNSDIVSYNLYWNAGNSTTADTLVTDTLTNTFTFSGLTGGTLYIFKVRARNVYGYGDFSDEVGIEAVDVPAKIDIATVTLSVTDVIIDWNAPYDHYSPIEEYEIRFRASNGVLVSYLCDGTISTVITYT